MQVEKNTMITDYPACWGFDDLFFNLLLEFMYRDAKSKDILIHKYQMLEVTDSGGS
jgi:hypothetical protein